MRENADLCFCMIYVKPVIICLDYYIEMKMSKRWSSYYRCNVGSQNIEDYYTVSFLDTYVTFTADLMNTNTFFKALENYSWNMISIRKSAQNFKNFMKKSSIVLSQFSFLKSEYWKNEYMVKISKMHLMQYR